MQEMEKGGDKDEGKVKEAIQTLEQEKKLMEEMPDLQLETRTKRLRQACFKANYKKRKLINNINYDNNINTSQSSSSSSATTTIDNTHEIIQGNNGFADHCVIRDVMPYSYFAS